MKLHSRLSCSQIVFFPFESFQYLLIHYCSHSMWYYKPIHHHTLRTRAIVSSLWSFMPQMTRKQHIANSMDIIIPTHLSIDASRSSILYHQYFSYRILKVFALEWDYHDITLHLVFRNPKINIITIIALCYRVNILHSSTIKWYYDIFLYIPQRYSIMPFTPHTF